MSKFEIRRYLEIHKKYVTELKTLNMKIRQPNFPESISEYLIKFYIEMFENRKCTKATIGDLEIDGNRIEVKCFTSRGPTSFGPSEKWKQLYFMDATMIYTNGRIKIYKCESSNDSEMWQKVQVNKNENFLDKCKKGHRPRIKFKSLLLQQSLQFLPNSFLQLVYDGHVDLLFKEECINNVNMLSTVHKLKLVDFCAGSGAFSYIFHKIGFTETVFANDLKKECKLFFEENINKTSQFVVDDIFNIKNETIPSMDILTAGFPCQPFSIAGNKTGFKDPRSNVFLKLMDILLYHKPRFVVFENVKNLQTHDKCQSFVFVLDEMKKAKYFVKYKVLNTCTISSIPHNRERLFILGFRHEEDYLSFEFPSLPMNHQIKPLKEFLEKTVASKYYYDERSRIYPKLLESVTKTIDQNVMYQYRRFYVRENKNHVCPTLTENMGSGGHNVPILKDDYGIRKLTPRECFSLQGFPDDFVFPTKLCDSVLYKMAGNAVSLPVIEEIGKQLLKILENP